MSLTPDQLQSFVEDGFVRLDDAFPRSLADECRAILWRDTGCDPNDPSTWTKPVIRLGGYSDPPFIAAANTPRLVAAFDQLVGANRWIPLRGLGTFPVRFPSPEDPGDTGWHVDASLPPADPADTSYFSWRINVRSQGRALLLLFLFSDVSERDAATRIRVGSHTQVARILEPAGDAGLSFMALAQQLDQTRDCREALATGFGGTVYLCHPFLAHAAQLHHGTEPRFLAQPPLVSREPFDVYGAPSDSPPVELAVRLALGR